MQVNRDLRDRPLRAETICEKMIVTVVTYPLYAAYKSYSFVYGFLPTRLQYLASSVTHSASAYGIFKAATISNVRLCQYFPPGVIQIVKIGWKGAKCVSDFEKCNMPSLNCSLPIFIKGPMLIGAVVTGALAANYLKEAILPSPHLALENAR